jgi:hypothetical protein
MMAGSGCGARILRIAMKSAYRSTARGLRYGRDRHGSGGRGDPALRAKAPKPRKHRLIRRYRAR